MPTHRLLALLVCAAIGCAHADRESAPPFSSPVVHAAAPVSADARASSHESSIDTRLQNIAEEELLPVVDTWRPDAATVLVLDPFSGEILANAGRTGTGPGEVAIGSTFVTGSTLKPLVLAAALEENAVNVGDRFDCEQGARTYPTGLVLQDPGSFAELGLPQMLAVSTNIGFSKLFDRLGGARLLAWLRRFHLGAAPALSGAATGALPESVEDGSFQGGVLAAGELAKASPLQMALAYAVFANGGSYVTPTLTRRGPSDVRLERVISERTQKAVLGMLGDAVYLPEGTGRTAQIDGVRVAGKTGTSSYEGKSGEERAFASFIGIVPADKPRFVIFVGAERVWTDGYVGPKVAAPVFARVAARALQLK